MHHPKPDFLGIGAQKAGTTWVYYQLRKHPDIWAPYKKEMHFFDRSPEYPTTKYLAIPSFFSRLIHYSPGDRRQLALNMLRIGKNIAVGDFPKARWWGKWTFGYYDENWYKSLFPKDHPGKICGEITPSYSILEKKDIESIKAINPEIKIIFIIRDPVDRAWSAIRYSISRGHRAVDLRQDENAVSDKMIAISQKQSITLFSDYERTLDQYLSHFDSSQILVAFYDSISEDPGGLMSALANFLEISSFPQQLIDNQNRINAAPQRKMPDRVRKHLKEFYAPMSTRLARQYGSYAAGWQGVETEVQPREMTPVFHP
jgi:hypothetical protein